MVGIGIASWALGIARNIAEVMILTAVVVTGIIACAWICSAVLQGKRVRTRQQRLAEVADRVGMNYAPWSLPPDVLRPVVGHDRRGSGSDTFTSDDSGEVAFGTLKRQRSDEALAPEDATPTFSTPRRRGCECGWRETSTATSSCTARPVISGMRHCRQCWRENAAARNRVFGNVALPGPERRGLERRVT